MVETDKFVRLYFDKVGEIRKYSVLGVFHYPKKDIATLP